MIYYCIGKDPLVAQSFMAGLHTSKIDERSVEGVINAPASKPHGDLRTFDLTTTDYVPGQEETLGWSRADTGRLNRSEEVSNASYNTPIAAHSGRLLVCAFLHTDCSICNTENSRKCWTTDCL